MDLVGQVFGKLTVVSKAPSIYGGNTIKRWWGAWNCECECGSKIIAKTTHLRKGGVRSCGCLIGQFGKTLKPNQKINRLTTISYSNGKWKCSCECGKIIEASTSSLMTENTKSCGCLRSELLSERSHKLQDGRRQFEPRISSARRVWQGYITHDPECMGFDDFYELSQKNCNYCGIEPHKKFNYSLVKSTNSSSFAKENGLFVYNGIDRVDNAQPHIKENCVPCCLLCNAAKNDRTIIDFYTYIDNLIYDKVYQNYEKIVPNNIIMPTGSFLLTSIKWIYEMYSDGNITLEQFYYLSQLDCFYCGVSKLNISDRRKNIATKTISQEKRDSDIYYYNGLDRIDPTLPHLLSNCVPCCYYCNFAKSNNTFDEFQAWIKRIKTFRVAKIAEKTG